MNAGDPRTKTHDDDVDLGVLNVGVARYAVPLGANDEKKLERLGRLARFHVVAFSTSLAYRRASSPVELYLVPLVPTAALRLVALVAFTIGIGLRLVYRRRVHVVVSQGPYEGIAGIALRGLGRAIGRPVVVVTEVHGDWTESPFLYHRVPLSSLWRPVLAAWARFVLCRSDRIRTISAYLERQIAGVAPDVPRHRFPTYTDFELFGAEAHPANGDGPLLAAGALYPVKGFDTLIRAMKRVTSERPDARLHLAGDGPLRNSLEEEARRASVAESVRFLGAMSPAELEREYQNARLFVLPSLSEGLGRVVWEAMACGLPVVASNVGGIPELVEDGETGFLVPPRDENALAERILWLLDHPEDAGAMGARGRRAAQALYSTEGYVEGYREIFRAAEAQRRPATS